jgi:hypothetical protein
MTQRCRLSTHSYFWLSVGRRRSGQHRDVVTDEILRRAIFDPAVRTRRVSGRQAGLFIDANDLHQAVTRLAPIGGSGDEEVDAAIRRHGGHPVDRLVGKAARAAVRYLTRRRWPSPSRQQYWLDMYSWQKLRQRPR